MASQGLQRVFLSLIFLLIQANRIHAISDSLELTFPPAVPSSFQAHFHYGQNVTFTWTNSFPNITLQLVQGPDPNNASAIKVNTLLDGVNGDTTAHNWTAHNLANYLKTDSPFHLYLFATNNRSCDTCHSNSTQFWINPPSETEKESFKVGLGVGLGVGIPLFASVVGLTIWWCARRSRQKRYEIKGWHPDEETSTPMPEPPVVESKSPAEAGGSEVKMQTPLAEAPGETVNRRLVGELEGDHDLMPRRLSARGNEDQ